jgi:hypothetical protein
MRAIDRCLHGVLMSVLALGLAGPASAVLLEIEIRATGIDVEIEPGGLTYAGVSMVALGTYDSADVTEVDPGAGPVGYVPVDLSIALSGVGSFTSIGLGVWDLDDPENPFGGVLLVSDPAITIGFALGSTPPLGDIGFDLTQPFALVAFPLTGVQAGAFPTTSGQSLFFSCGDEEEQECEGRFSVQIREAAIPEPSAALLFAVGLGITAARIRRPA